MWFIPLARVGGYNGNGFYDRLLLVVVVLVIVVLLLVVFDKCNTTTSTATATDRITEKPWISSRWKRNRRRRLVSVDGGRRCSPVQELNILVELWVIRYGGCGHSGCSGCSSHGSGGGGTFDAAYERVDQK